MPLSSVFAVKQHSAAAHARLWLRSVLAVVVVVAGIPLVGSAVFAAQNPPCADAAPSETEAVALAKACDRGVEVSPKTSEISRMVAQPDGLLRHEQHVVPQRVRRGGGWVPVDTRLQRLPGGAVAPIASTVDIKFSAGGSDPLVTVSAQGGTASMSWPGSLPTPVIEGDTAVYREVLAGVDLRVRATAAGFTHVLVVKTRQAATNPTLRQVAYLWSGNGLTMTPGEDGALQLSSGSRVVLASLPGMMWDSARTESGTSGAALGKAMAQGDVGEGTVGDESTPEAPGDLARTAAVGVSLDGQRMLLTPDTALLDDAATVFPLYIDPPWPSTLQRWVYASSTNSNRNDGIARVGYNPDGSGNYRSFFEFQLGADINYKPVYNARFYTTLIHSSACVGTTVSLWRATGISTSIPNGGRVAWSPSLTDHLDEQFGHANKGSCSDAPQDDDPMEFGGNLTTKVQQWTSSGWGSVVLALSTRRADGTGESNSYYWKKFDPADTSMTIWYNYAPNTPVVQPFDLTQCYKDCTSPARVRVGLPTLRASVSDPDGGAKLRTDFEVRMEASEEAIKLSWGQSAEIQAPGIAIWTIQPASTCGTSQQTPTTFCGVIGKTVYWRARSVDEVGWYGPWTSWQQLTGDATAPAAPTVSSSQYPINAWGATVGTQGTFTLSSSSSDTAEFVWSVDGGSYSEPVPATGSSPRTASVTWTPAADMVHTLSVKATDSAGNASGVYNYQFWVPPMPNKYAHWSLDETAGTTAVDSGNAEDHGGELADAALSGSVAFGSGHVGGTNGLVFIGDGYAAAAGPVIDTTKEFTVMAWVNPSDLTADRTILSQDGATSSRFQLHFDSDANGGSGGWCVGMRVSDGGALTTACTDGASLGTPITGQWVHVAAVYKPGLSSQHLRIYVMGDPDSCFDPFPETAAVDFTATWSATGSFVIGRAKAGDADSEHWRGRIDDVWAYQKALTGTEICQHAQP